MFFNYLKVALRNLQKQKGYSFINISGLAIGMVCCVLLAIYISSELEFDTYHKKANRIFRVYEKFDFSNYHGKESATNGVIAKALKKGYPEVEETARLDYFSATVNYNSEQFTDRFYYFDESVFDIFTWPLIKGDPRTALSAPYSIVLTEETANKYFGSEDPIGKIIKVNSSDEYQITGVMSNIPKNSTFQFAGLASFSTLYGQNESLNHMLTAWSSHNFETFVLLKEGIDYKEFQKKIKDIYFDYMAEELTAKGASYEVFLQPLRDIYLRPLNQEFGPLMYVYIFSAVALFILLLACANFMNLSTARSMNRAAEVGMRKVLGANRGRLIFQFLGEAMIISFLSIVIAIGIVYLVLPQISSLIDRDLSQNLFSISWLIPGIVVIAVLVGFIAGSYPAVFLSKFQPVHTIKGGYISPKRKVNFRRSLVLLQFTISIIMVIGTWIVIQQLNYLKERDPGFNKDHVIFLMLRDETVRKSLPVLKEKVKNLQSVIDVGAGSTLPGWGTAINDKIPEGYTDENVQLMLDLNVDENYLQTLGIEIVKGRNFSKEFGGDSENSVIINEAAAKSFGWQNPIGKTIKALNFNKPDVREWIDKTVIGVVKDYNIEGITRKIEPAIISNTLNHPFSFGKMKVMVVKIKPAEVKPVIASIEKIWKDIMRNKPFSYYFLDEDFNEQFLSIEKSRDIFSYFTFIAVFIACLGLFGMASYAAENRTKEIGIRKVLGSGVVKIYTLLSKELLYLVLVANIIAYPIAYYLITDWLKEFPYRMEISAYTFLFTSILVFAISLFTTGFQSIKAALANPVESLKYE